MKKPKRSLRSTLEDLTAVLVDGILASARESLLELAAHAPKPRERPRAVRATPRPAAARRTSLDPAAPPSDAASDLAITDPLALLAALETASPASPDELAWDEPAFAEASAERREPEILAVAPAVVPPPDSAPALREGEVIVRRSAGGVVLRRRRA